MISLTTNKEFFPFPCLNNNSSFKCGDTHTLSTGGGIHYVHVHDAGGETHTMDTTPHVHVLLTIITDMYMCYIRHCICTDEADNCQKNWH